MEGGVVYWSVLCYHPYLVPMLFADLLSLHLVTFLMFFINVIYCTYSTMTLIINTLVYMATRGIFATCACECCLLSKRYSRARLAEPRILIPNGFKANSSGSSNGCYFAPRLHQKRSQKVKNPDPLQQARFTRFFASCGSHWKPPFQMS